MSLLEGLLHPMYKLYGTKQAEVADPLVDRMSGLTAREKSLCFMDTENLPDKGQREDSPPKMEKKTDFNLYFFYSFLLS